MSFVTDMLRFAGNASGASAHEIEAKLFRLETLYRQLVPNTETPAPAPIPMALLRSCSLKVVCRIARLAGDNKAPPKPCAARHAISTLTFGENPLMTEGVSF